MNEIKNKMKKNNICLKGLKRVLISYRKIELIFYFVLLGPPCSKVDDKGIFSEEKISFVTKRNNTSFRPNLEYGYKLYVKYNFLAVERI